MKVIYLMLVSILLFACKTETQKEKAALFANYFYPVQKEVQVYIYQDSINGLNERFFRVYKTKGKEEDYLNVDRYTSDFRITEAYQYSIKDSLMVNDHMVVGADGYKRKAKIRAHQMFPKTMLDESFFSSHFPSALDSVVLFYDVKSNVLDSNYSTTFNNKTYKAILVRDSIKFIEYNPITKKSNSAVAAQNSVYAKGLGLVSYGAVNKSIVFKLQKIVSDADWKIITKQAM